MKLSRSARLAASRARALSSIRGASSISRRPTKLPFGEPAEALGQVLAIIEAGDDALDRTYETMKKAPSDTLTQRSSRLLAPVPRPPQMRAAARTLPRHWRTWQRAALSA